MEDWRLPHSPLLVSILQRGVLRKDSGEIPVEQIWIVDESLGVDLVVVGDDGSGVLQPSAQPSRDEETDVEVGDPASDVEVLDRQFSDEEQAQHAPDLGPGCVVGEIEIRFVGWASQHLFQVLLVSAEPSSQLKYHHWGRKLRC